VAEEVQNASVSVPKGMMNALYLSGSMGLLLVITLVLSIPDTRAAIIDDTGYPYMYIMKLAWPGAGLSAVTCILIILLTLGNLSFLASAARLLCAFARDSGLPYQAWLSKVLILTIVNTYVVLTGVGRSKAWITRQRRDSNRTFQRVDVCHQLRLAESL
jgi:amino acid transporter